jgi:hypothetical protein
MIVANAGVEEGASLIGTGPKDNASVVQTYVNTGSQWVLLAYFFYAGILLTWYA